MNLWTGVRARLLTPLYYHGIYVPDGSATDPRFLTDTAMVFALAAALGCSPTQGPRATPNYRADLERILWRASLFISTDAHLMAPIRHTIDVEREGGNTETMQANMASGNFKKTFYVNEVAPDAQYFGALWGPDPFKALGVPSLIVRMGVGRTGIVELHPTALPEKVVLNAATARLFGQIIPEAYRVLDTIRPSPPLSLDAAEKVLAAC